MGKPGLEAGRWRFLFFFLINETFPKLHREVFTA